MYTNSPSYFMVLKLTNLQQKIGCILQKDVFVKGLCGLFDGKLTQ